MPPVQRPMTTFTPLAWNQIDTVLLDMDGTLLDLYYDSFFWLDHLHQVYAKKNNIELEAASAILRPIFRDHAGTLNWYDVNFWSDALDIDIMLEKSRHKGRIAFLPGAQDFLQMCRSQVQDLRLITNGHRKVLELKVRETGLDQYFDNMLCSHELGAPKEQLGFWEDLHQRHEFDLNRTVFIDDNESVLDAAAEFGVGYIYSVARPDSSQPREHDSKYPMLKELLHGFRVDG
jgi:putative hydrolase of the HAD superfamily